MVSANREMVAYCFDTLVAHYNNEEAPPPAFDEGQQYGFHLSYSLNFVCFLWCEFYVIMRSHVHYFLMLELFLLDLCICFILRFDCDSCFGSDVCYAIGVVWVWVNGIGSALCICIIVVWCLSLNQTCALGFFNYHCCVWYVTRYLGITMFDW